MFSISSGFAAAVIAALVVTVAEAVAEDPAQAWKQALEKNILVVRENGTDLYFHILEQGRVEQYAQRNQKSAIDQGAWSVGKGGICLKLKKYNQCFEPAQPSLDKYVIYPTRNSQIKVELVVIPATVK